jgi:ABC-type ATPase involved in cell division
MVEFQRVSKLYRRRGGAAVPALVDITASIGAGELVVVTGPTGAGKSTLLRLVYGAERPSRGVVRVDGEDVAGLGWRGRARLRRRLGVVPQGGGLLAERTVLGNLTVALQALGVPRAEIVARARQTLGAAGLGEALRARPGELSGGERERLALARALVGAPRLLVLDEPVPTLAGAALAGVAGLVRAARSAGATVLVATQCGELAAGLGGRRLRLEAGRLASEAAPV